MAPGTTMARSDIHPTYDPSIDAEAEEESVYFYQNFLIGKSLKDIALCAKRPTLTWN